MKWTNEAESAIRKVPFFVRKRVRTRVEEEANKAGKTRVSLADVHRTQQRYLAKMGDEIKGYQLETCFGTSGCPNRTVDAQALFGRLEQHLEAADIRRFLDGHVDGDLKHHHEFRVSVSDCPNACSQPQIRDIGIMGASEPTVTDHACSGCRGCVDACIENAITLDEDGGSPRIDGDRCVKCGKCIGACPTGTIVGKRTGYRVLLGGKLGRHPRLAEELPGIFSEDEVVDIVKKCLSIYKRLSTKGRRFADIFNDPGLHDRIVSEILDE